MYIVIVDYIDYIVPSRQLRYTHLRILRIPRHRTDYRRFQTITNMLSLFNAIYNEFDFNLNLNR